MDSKKTLKVTKKTHSVKETKKPHSVNETKKYKILTHILLTLIASGGIGLGVAAYNNKEILGKMKIKEKDLYFIVKKILNNSNI